jgi:hypothetical protein
LLQLKDSRGEGTLPRRLEQLNHKPLRLLGKGPKRIGRKSRAVTASIREGLEPERLLVTDTQPVTTWRAILQQLKGRNVGRGVVA